MNSKTLDGLIDVYLDHYRKNGEASLKFFVESTVPSLFFLIIYKGLKPIEEMPEPEKTDFKKYVIEMFPDKSTEEQVKAAKIIYTISQLL